MRNYRHILLAMGLTAAVNGMMYPVMALYMYGISEDFFLVGLIMGLPFLAAVPMSFAWGAISDRFASRRLVMAVAGTAGGALFFAMPFVDSGWLIFLKLVQVAFTTSFVLLNAVATECFPKRKGTSVGNLALVGGIGQALGALAAGFLLPSSELTMGSDAVILLFSLAGMLTIAGSLSLLPMRERRWKPRSIEYLGILAFGKRKDIATVTAVAFILPLAGYIVFSVFPIYLKGLAIPWDATMVAGMFTALSAVTGIFASSIAGRACDRHGRKWVLVGAGAAYALVWGGMGITTHPVLIAALWAVPVWSFFTVSAITMVSDLTKPAERGRGVGLVNSALNMGGAAGSILAGYLLSRNVMDNTFLLASAVSLVGLLVALATRETLPGRRFGRQREISR